MKFPVQECDQEDVDGDPFRRRRTVAHAAAHRRTGYGDDEESQKLRGFFDRGNAYTLKKLQEKFAAKEEKPSNGR